MTPMTETAKLEALKPCPFCGGDKIFVQNAGWQANTFMRCPGCRITMSIDNGSPRAHVDTVAAWNTRALSVSRPAVKGLEWRDDRFGAEAATSIVRYMVEDMGENWTDDRYWLQSDKVLGKYPTIRAAKAAAQSDFEQRILSSLSPPTGGGAIEASCPGCNGTGDQGGNPSYGACDDCSGSGRVSQPLPSPPEAE